MICYMAVSNEDRIFVYAKSLLQVLFLHLEWWKLNVELFWYADWGKKEMVKLNTTWQSVFTLPWEFWCFLFSYSTCHRYGINIWSNGRFFRTKMIKNYHQPNKLCEFQTAESLIIPCNQPWYCDTHNVISQWYAWIIMKWNGICHPDICCSRTLYGSQSQSFCSNLLKQGFY